jgi:hypothetical protein
MEARAVAGHEVTVAAGDALIVTAR